MMQSIQFDISNTAEKDSEVWIIPADIYKKLMEKSAVLANYTNEVMATRFTDVMWLIEQVTNEEEIKNLINNLVTHPDVPTCVK